MDTVLVVGATGQVGYAVVKKLRQKSVSVRALVRSPEQFEKLRKLSAEPVIGDLIDAPSMVRACAGVKTVIATANAAIPRRNTDTFDAVERRGYRNLIHAAVEARVQRFIYVSVPASKYDWLSPLLTMKRETEALLAQSGLNYIAFRADIFMDTAFTMMGSSIPLRGSENATILRPCKFVETSFARVHDNIERKHVAMIPGDGTSRHAFICADDMASFLTAAAFSGPLGVHTAAGPEALSFVDIAALYKRVIGAQIRTQRAPAQLFRMAVPLLKRFSPAGANLMALNYIAAREDSHPDNAVANGFGVRLTSAEEFLREKMGTAPVLNRS